MNIFNKDFSSEILFKFLNNFCNIENNYYIIDNNCYKKYLYYNNINNINNNKNIIDNFINEIKPYYKNHKKFYIERELNYNNLMTIIRQICKYKKIPYRNYIKYDKSKYEIIYYIKKENFNLIT